MRYLAIFYNPDGSSVALGTFSTPIQSELPGIFSYTMQEGKWYFLYVSTDSVSTAIFIIYNQELNQITKAYIPISATFSQNSYLSFGGISPAVSKGAGIYARLKLSDGYHELWSTLTSENKGKL
jgi:hypothetical protein